MSSKSPISKLLPIVFVALALAVAWIYQRPEGSSAATEVMTERASSRGSTLADPRSGQMVEVKGRVSRLLSDDREGSRHQRFILTLGDGRTVLVAHNIDLAPRVPLEAGDTARVRGQFEQNERGGVLHWTHHDPDGSRRDTGWIEHEGRVYE